MDFDTLLHRRLRDKKEFENLIPKPPNTSESTGNGDTDFSISEIAEMAYLYNWQMQEAVEQKLRKRSFEENIFSVKDFVYNNFQYKADATLQKLRSPARAFQDREDGIDCKSYSIITSCILLQLGIVHYIRKIMQPEFHPTEYTHVYVIVPLDQKSANLDNGYYTIDGTLETDEEPEFVEAKDLFMSLPHERLNGAYMLNGGISFSAVKSLFDSKNLTSIKGILSAIDCLTGSSYTNDRLEEQLKATDLYYNTLVDKINNAVITSNKTELMKLVAEFFAMSVIFAQSSQNCLDDGWNSCTTKLLKVQIEAFKFYRDVVGKALQAWLDDNFTEDNTNNGTMLFTTGKSATLLATKYHMYYLCNGEININEELIALTPKAKKIPQFQLTKYVADLSGTNGNNFNPLAFLKTLVNTAVDFTGNTNNGTTQVDNGTGYDTNGNQIIPKDKTPNQAGLGTIAGVVIVLVGVGIAFSKMKDEPNVKIKK